MRQRLYKRVKFVWVLRHRDYRVYYFGLLASVTAHQGMIAAQGWLAFDLTGEPLTLGVIGAAQALPGIVFNLLAGAMADRIDPRRMIVLGEGVAGVLMAALAVLVLTGLVQVWHIVGVAFLTGIATSFDQPARRVVWPALIPRSLARRKRAQQRPCDDAPGSPRPHRGLFDTPTMPPYTRAARAAPALRIGRVQPGRRRSCFHAQAE